MSYDRNSRWNVDTKSANQNGKKRRTVRKKLHWHAIKMKEEEVSVVSTHQTQVKESYWGGLEKLALIQNDMDKMKEFEDIFVNNPDENKQKEVKPVEKDKGPKLVSVSRGAELQVTFLDGKRSTNIGIAMSKVKADYASLRRALLLMKPELANITMDTVESLRVALPTAEDLQAAKGYSGPPEQLAPVWSGRFVSLSSRSASCLR